MSKEWSRGDPGVLLQIGEVLDDLKNCHGSIWTNSWVIQELSLRWPLVISSFARNSVKVTKNLFADSSHLRGQNRVKKNVAISGSWPLIAKQLLVVFN